MSNNNSKEMPSRTNQKNPKNGWLDVLRIVAFFALVVGAIGSLVFMFRAGQNTPRFLLILFILWVLSPFVVILWTTMVSKRWSILTRITLYCVAILIALGSLAIYSGWINVRPAGSANAFLFVAVPPVSLIFAAIVVPIAAFLSGRMSRVGDGT